jgi:hypothetical protein
MQTELSHATAEANDTIRAWAQDASSDDRTPWDFLCECGEGSCRGRVRMTLARYDAARRANELLLTSEHRFARMHAARMQAAELREEARAVRNQARHQLTRTSRLESSGRGPTCGSTDWRSPED